MDPAAGHRRRILPLKPGRYTVVIGARPAGLTAAVLLSKAGSRVTVLEADVIVSGGHRFFPKIRPVAELWEELEQTRDSLHPL